jgi:hypothetical protein
MFTGSMCTAMKENLTAEMVKTSMFSSFFTTTFVMQKQKALTNVRLNPIRGLRKLQLAAIEEN